MAPTLWNKFVSENIKRVKTRYPNLKYPDILKKLSAEYQELKQQGKIVVTKTTRKAKSKKSPSKSPVRLKDTPVELMPVRRHVGNNNRRDSTSSPPVVTDDPLTNFDIPAPVSLLGSFFTTRSSELTENMLLNLLGIVVEKNSMVHIKSQRFIEYPTYIQDGDVTIHVTTVVPLIDYSENLMKIPTEFIIQGRIMNSQLHGAWKWESEDPRSSYLQRFDKNFLMNDTFKSPGLVIKTDYDLENENELIQVVKVFNVTSEYYVKNGQLQSIVSKDNSLTTIIDYNPDLPNYYTQTVIRKDEKGNTIKTYTEIAYNFKNGVFKEYVNNGLSKVFHYVNDQLEGPAFKIRPNKHVALRVMEYMDNKIIYSVDFDDTMHVMKELNPGDAAKVVIPSDFS